MILNEELLAVQRGEQGEAMRKVLNTLVMYGEACPGRASPRIPAAWSLMYR